MTNLDYGMYSKAGNQRIASIVIGALKLPIATTNAQLYSYLKERMKRVAEKYPEVWDSDVRSAVISVLERKLHRELTMYF
jgi:hypothetical protein